MGYLLAMAEPTGFPWPLRYAATIFLVVFVAVHAWYANLVTFLWLSDIGLFGAVASLWFRSRLLASMMLLAVALPDGVGWTMDFLLGLALGWHPLHATHYMFDPRVPAIVRVLSLYHLVVPALLVWMVRRIGYDRRALPAQAALTALLFAVSYVATDPARNINWVFGPGGPQTAVPGWVYLLALVTVFPFMCYLPVHLAMIGLKWDRKP
jgi:hypothetical protein